mgnify:CR=1 FL=1
MNKTLFISWGWLLGLFTAAAFLETVFWGQMTAFTPIFLKDLGVAQKDIAYWTGVIAAIVGAAGIPFLPFWGALADRYSRQPIIVRSFVAYLLAGILAVLAGNVWVFVIGRSIMSLSLGNSGLMMATLSERTPLNRQGFAFGLMNSAGPIGAFIGPLLGGPIVDQFGFRTLLFINVIIQLIVVTALSFGYRDTYQSGRREPILKMAGDLIRVSFRTPRLCSVFFALFLLSAGWMLTYNYIPVVISSIYHGNNPASAIGYILGGGGFFALILAPIIGSLADRIGFWKVLTIGAGILSALWITPYFTRDIISFGILWAIINGIASSIFSISFNVLATSTTDEYRGRVMSFAYLPVNLGFFFGPFIGSYFVKQDLFIIFPIALVFTVLSLFVMSYAQRQPVMT